MRYESEYAAKLKTKTPRQLVRLYEVNYSGLQRAEKTYPRDEVRMAVYRVKMDTILDEIEVRA